MGCELAEKYKVTCLFKVGTAHSDCTVNANCHYVQSNCILGPLLRLSPKLKQRFKVQCPLRGSPPPLPYNSPSDTCIPLFWVSIPKGHSVRACDSEGCGETQPPNLHSSSRGKRRETRAEARRKKCGVESQPSPESNLLAFPPSLQSSRVPRKHWAPIVYLLPLMRQSPWQSEET